MNLSGVKPANHATHSQMAAMALGFNGAAVTRFVHGQYTPMLIGTCMTVPNGFLAVWE